MVDGAVGVDADQVPALGGRLNVVGHAGGVPVVVDVGFGGRRVVGGDGQVGIVGHDPALLPQIGDHGRHRRPVEVPILGQLEGAGGVFRAGDQVERELPLADRAGLADQVAVEADEVGVFGGQIGGEDLVALE